MAERPDRLTCHWWAGVETVFVGVPGSINPVALPALFMDGQQRPAIA